MRYAIISDIHGNREALDVCLSDARHQGVDAVLCLGDLIGYGPDPNEVVERVREEADIIVGGNHDAGVVINARNARTPDGINLEGADYVTIEVISLNILQRTGNCKPHPTLRTVAPQDTSERRWEARSRQEA